MGSVHEEEEEWNDGAVREEEDEEEEEELRPLNLEGVFAMDARAARKRRSGEKEEEERDGDNNNNNNNNNNIDSNNVVERQEGDMIFEAEDNQSVENRTGKKKFGSSSSGLSVVLRVRDNSDREPCLHGVGLRSLALVPPEDSNAFKAGESGSQYTFSRVFGSSTTQQQLFHEVCEPVCGRVVAALAEANGGGVVGRHGSANGVVMCYGITAAGKTYTIEGSEDEPGMLPRTVAYLLHHMPHGCCLQLSHYEVYNDQVYDLLAQPDDHAAATADADMKHRDRRVPLRVMEDAYGRVNVTNALWVQLDNDETLAMRDVRRTLRRRATGSTKLNANSSRSHSVVILRAAAAHDASIFHDITFVDLAGSERASRTNNDGIRLKESACINSSLMALGRCLEALRYNSEYHSATRVVPFRESKITHIFRDVLHGRGQLMLMVNVSTAAGDYDETTHVLRYAALAAGVATTRSKSAAVVSDNDSTNPRKRMRMTALPRVATLARKPGTETSGSGMGKASAAPSTAGGGGSSHARGQSARVAGAVKHIGVVAEFEEYVSDDDDDNIADDDEDNDDGGAHDEIDGEASEHVQACIQLLTSRLHEAEKRAASLEAEVREEVAGEVAQMLRDMEQQHARQLENDRAQIGPSRVRELEKALLLMQETNEGLERQLRLEREQHAASSGATEELEQRMRRELDEEKVQVVANMSLELETAESLLATVTSKNATLVRENEEMKDTILKLLKVVEGDADHDEAGQILRVDRAGLASTFPWLRRKLSLRSSNDGNEPLQLVQDPAMDQQEEQKVVEETEEEEHTHEEESDRRSTREKYSTSPKMTMPESASKPVRVMASEYDTLVIDLQKKEDEEEHQRGRKARRGGGGSSAKPLKQVDADMTDANVGTHKHRDPIRRSRRLSSVSREQDPAAVGNHEATQPSLATVDEREDDSEAIATDDNTDDTGLHIVEDAENLEPAACQDANVGEEPAADGEEKTRVPKPRTKRTKKLLSTKSDDADFNSQIAEALGEAEPIAVVAPTPIARRTRQRKPMAMR